MPKGSGGSSKLQAALGAQSVEFREALREELREQVYGIQEPIRKLVAQFTDKEVIDPALVQTVDGTLVCAFSTREPPLNWTTEPPNLQPGVIFKTYITRSSDGGETWSTPVQILTGEPDPWVTCIIMTGTFAGGYGWVESHNLILFYINFGSTDIYCIRSTDDGVTWGARIAIAVGVDGYYEPHACFMRNATILCAYRKALAANLLRTGIFCRVSADFGLTWGAEVTIEPIAGINKYYHDGPVPVQLYDGNVICGWRLVVATAGLYRPTAFYRISTDYGATWGARQTMSEYLHFTAMNQLFNGDLVAIGRAEVPLDGTVPKWGSALDMVVSRDSGFTWGGRETLIQNLSKWNEGLTDLGYGDLQKLDNGKLVFVYTEVPKKGEHYAIYMIDVFSERLIDKLNRILGLQAERKYTNGFETERVM